MRTSLKYAIFLVLVVASGFYIVHGPVSREDIRGLVSLEDIAPFLAMMETPVARVDQAPPAIVHGPVSLEDIAPILAKSEAPVAHIDPAPSASIDEELDYLVAKRLGSLAGWRAFLAAHGGGAYAQFARAEVEKRLPTENAATEAAVAPVAAEVSHGVSTDAGAPSKAMGPIPPPRGTEVASKYAVPAPIAAEVSNDTPPDSKAVDAAARAAPPLARTNASRGTEVAALTPDVVCKRDGDRLARLGGDEAARFANESGCETLGPQILGLMESLPKTGPAPAAAEVSNDASSDAKAVNDAAPAAPLAGKDVAALTPDESCKRDEDRLARLRGSPSGEEAQRFASELACEKLRPQLRRLMESLGFAPPPSPANSSAVGTSLTEVCTSQRAALDRLRKEPSAEAARQFWRDLQCERLRPQVHLLMESLNLAPEPLGSVVTPGAAQGHEGATPDAPTPNAPDPTACRRETAELNRIRAAPDLGDAKRFASIVTCDELKPQATRLLESLAE
jgi:hypothetical protein